MRDVNTGERHGTDINCKDDMNINNLLREALQKQGYSCVQAFSGTEALLVMEQKKFALMLLDLMLPGISGEEVLGKVREKTDMRIAVISDTHGLLRPEVLDVIETCEVIIHGGDINNADILQELSNRRPLYVVRGNNDKEWAKSIPETRQFELEGLTFFAVHNKKDVPGDLTGVDVIIFGHSHKYYEEVREERLWLNPGSCGRRRFSQPITMAVMEVENGAYNVGRIDIPAGENAGNLQNNCHPSRGNQGGNHE